MSFFWLVWIELLSFSSQTLALYWFWNLIQMLGTCLEMHSNISGATCRPGKTTIIWCHSAFLKPISNHSWWLKNSLKSLFWILVLAISHLSKNMYSFWIFPPFLKAKLLPCLFFYNLSDIFNMWHLCLHINNSI